MSNEIFQFSHSHFPNQLMPCNRVNCAECLTRLALKNNLRGVQRFLCNMDHTVPMEIFVTFPFSALPRPITNSHNRSKEAGDIANYILKGSSHHNHLSFAALVASRETTEQRWTYTVQPFYSLILECDWVNGDIVRLILKSGIINPFETHIQFTLRYQEVEDLFMGIFLHPQYSIETTNIIETLLNSPFHAHVPDVLNATTVNESFPQPRRFNVNFDVLKKAMAKPEFGYWSNGIHLWDLRGETLHPSFKWQGVSLFMTLLRAHWESTAYRKDISSANFRNRLFRPMIRLGLDVNLHATTIYSWNPMHCSMLTYMLAEFIRHGLSNFHSTSHASIPLILACNSLSILRRKRYHRRWGKLKLIVRMVHLLGGSWQLYPCQIRYERKVLDMLRKRQMRAILFHPLSQKIRWLGYGIEPKDWDSMRKTLKYVRALRRQPLRLLDLSRISIRKAVGGQHFEAAIRQLPLPQKMKSFVRADIMPSLLAR